MMCDKSMQLLGSVEQKEHTAAGQQLNPQQVRAHRFVLVGGGCGLRLSPLTVITGHQTQRTTATSTGKQRHVIWWQL